MTLGDYIKDYRYNNDMSMDDFAKKCGLSKSYISMLERNRDGRGNAIFPKIETIQKVSEAIGVDVETVLRSIDQKVIVNGSLEGLPYKTDNMECRHQLNTKKYLKELDETVDINESIKKAYAKLDEGFQPISVFVRYSFVNKHSKVSARIGRIFYGYAALFGSASCFLYADNEMPEIVYLKKQSDDYVVVPTLELYELLDKCNVMFKDELNYCIENHLDDRIASQIPDEISKYSIEDLEKSIEIMKKLKASKHD